jgi:hypothetical protein
VTDLILSCLPLPTPLVARASSCSSMRMRCPASRLVFLLSTSGFRVVLVPFCSAFVDWIESEASKWLVLLESKVLLG